ncbi:hypothetical protein pb186bvf_008163 [Paramecium bursaria]
MIYIESIYCLSKLTLVCQFQSRQINYKTNQTNLNINLYPIQFMKNKSAKNIKCYNNAPYENFEHNNLK